MNTADLLRRRWQDSPLAPWGDKLAEQCAKGLSVERFGDVPRWQAAVAQLPIIEGVKADLDRPSITLHAEDQLGAPVLAQLETQLRALHPWRKGPFDVCGIKIDTEWRSDWKWARLAPHISPLGDRRVLDVGCGNGYHCWRMRGAGAREVIGIDPTPLFVFQFFALQRYINDPMVAVLPLGIESVPDSLRAFDTVFSMGILYHRRSPLRHLQTLRECLRPGGQLVLETLVIEGDAQQCLTPQGRYARMGNVWFLPSAQLLLVWLGKLGFRNPRIVHESVTSLDEQRATDWMQFHSLADFLDPDDRSRTIEGYPAPRRAIALAEAP